MDKTYKMKKYNVTVRYLNQVSIMDYFKESVDEVLVPKVMEKLEEKV